MPDLLFLYSNSIDWMEWSEALPSLEELNLSLTHGRLAGLWWCSRISFWALTTRRAPLPPSAVGRTIIQYKALSRLQQAEASPRQPLIHPHSPTPTPTTPTPRSSTGCNALWDWITKSQMQLVVLSEAVVSAICWHAPLCPCALVAGKLEFHQIFCAKDVYKKPKIAPDWLCFAAKQEESWGFLTVSSVVSHSHWG